MWHDKSSIPHHFQTSTFLIFSLVEQESRVVLLISNNLTPLSRRNVLAMHMRKMQEFMDTKRKKERKKEGKKGRIDNMTSLKLGYDKKRA